METDLLKQLYCYQRFEAGLFSPKNPYKETLHFSILTNFARIRPSLRNQQLATNQAR